MNPIEAEMLEHYEEVAEKYDAMAPSQPCCSGGKLALAYLLMPSLVLAVLIVKPLYAYIKWAMSLLDV